MFTEEVVNHLNYYVYRLIDPRNGQTFYVGKGLGNRVFSHAKGEIDLKEDELSDKLKRVHEIRNSGFEVAHVIHRHGLDEKTAFEVDQYHPLGYLSLCRSGVRISMDDKGRCLDNIFVEKLWRSLKYECVYLHAWETGSQVRAELKSWITFYNEKRPHSAHSGHPPSVVYWNKRHELETDQQEQRVA